MKFRIACTLAALVLLDTQQSFSSTPAGGPSEQHPGATCTVGFWYLNYRNLLGIRYNETAEYNLDFFQKSRTRQKMKDYLRDISFLAGVRLGRGTF
ncbi:MAG: hypothetical protein WBG01_11675 [Bacteroidota bacterium]